MNKLIALLTKPLQMVRTGLEQYSEEIHRQRLEKKYGFSRLPTVSLTDITGRNSGTVGPYSFLDGTSLLTDIFLLKYLAAKFRDCRYLEIGSWRGESIVNVSDEAAECVSVTLSDEEMRAMNFGEEFIRNHGIFSEGKHNIKTFRANSRTFDFSTFGSGFDLIFVDGDHTYGGVRSDTGKVFPLRKNGQSVIVWHDYGFSPETVRYSVLEGILDGLPAEAHRNLYHVSNTMCAVYMEDMPHSSKLTRFPARPESEFHVSLTIRKRGESR